MIMKLFKNKKEPKLYLHAEKHNECLIINAKVINVGKLIEFLENYKKTGELWTPPTNL